MINTRDRDEILISTVIKLIKRKAIPNLKNVIAKTHSTDIAPWFPRLRPEEQIILFDLLIQEGRMGEVLNELKSEERDLFIETTEVPVLADVLHTMPADDVSAILASLPEAHALYRYPILLHNRPHLSLLTFAMSIER